MPTSVAGWFIDMPVLDDLICPAFRGGELQVAGQAPVFIRSMSVKRVAAIRTSI